LAFVRFLAVETRRRADDLAFDRAAFLVFRIALAMRFLPSR
jgi:hypothetical protein